MGKTAQNNLDIKRQITPLEALFLLVVFVLPIWPRYAVIYLKPLPDLTLTRVLVFLLVGLWILTLLGFKGQSRVIIKRFSENTGVFLCLLLFFLSRSMSVLNSSALIPSVYVVLDDAVCLLLFFVTITVLRTPEQISRALFVIVLSSLVISSFGVYEAYKGYNFLHELFPAYTEGIERIFQSKYRLGYRIKSTFSNTLSLAEFLVFIIPITLFFLLRSKSPLARLASSTALVLALINLWFTESRGAAVAIIVMILLSYVFRARRIVRRADQSSRAFFLYIVSLVFVLFLAVLLPIVYKMTVGRIDAETMSSERRLYQMEIGIPLALERPFLGYGPGQAPYILGGEEVFIIDNYYLTTVIESGIIALFLFLVVIVKFISLAYRLNEEHEGYSRALTGILTFSVTGFSVFMLVLSIRQVLPFLFISFGMLIALGTKSGAPDFKYGPVNR